MLNIAIIEHVQNPCFYCLAGMLSSIAEGREKQQNVVNAAKKPVIINIFALSAIIILFSISPIKKPKINEPAIFTVIIAMGISKYMKFFKTLFDI